MGLKIYGQVEEELKRTEHTLNGIKGEGGKKNALLTFSLRLSIWVWEPRTTTFPGKFSSLPFRIE